MTETAKCRCCNLSVPVIDDRRGLRIVCPRTHRSFAVKKAAVHTTTPTKAQTAEAEPDAPAFRPSVWPRLIITTTVAVIVVASAVGLFVSQVKRSLRQDSMQELAIASSQPAEAAPPSSTPAIAPAQPAKPDASPSLPARPSVDPKPVEGKPAASEHAAAKVDPRPGPARPAEARSTESKPAVDAKPRLDAHGFEIHSLAMRLDHLKAEEIQKELQNLREVSLDALGSTKNKNELIQCAQTHLNRNTVFPGTIVSIKPNSDLAGLPFLIGGDALSSKERAEAMNVLSRQLREVIQTCVLKGDTRPNADELFQALLKGNEGGKRDRRIWATAESVPCIQQMLQPESRDIRRMSCELLRGLEIPEATEALVKWAVFDADSGNRAAAVGALKDRDRNDVIRLLLTYVRYPWPRAVEHACEALAALDCREAIPQMAWAYHQPDPDAPFQVDLPLSSGTTYVREVVRVNHLRNCVMCHPPSFEQSDLIRGAVPELNEPLPSPSTGYYRASSQFVTARITYLRQDFSMFQPVAKPGKWPEHQRYDYFVAVRSVTDLPARSPSMGSPYQKALACAIQKMSGRDPATDSEWLTCQKALAQPLENDNLEAAARFESIKLSPSALAAVKLEDLTHSLLRKTETDLRECVSLWQETYGQAETRFALIAHLAPFVRSGDAPIRARAARMLAAATQSADSSLADAVSRAARE